jgi:hypothetical protein
VPDPRRAALVFALLALASPAGAQDLPSLPPDSPLTIRPTDAARDLAEAVVRTLAIRMDVAVVIGDAAPPVVLEAVPSGHCAMAIEDEEVELVLAGPEGQVFRTLVEVEGMHGRDVVRAVSLAIEALRDVALDGPPPGSAPRRTFAGPGNRQVTWTYREAEGGLFGPRPRIEATAKPLVYLGFLLGLSTERLTAQVAPRIGFGLCQESWCALLEGDLPVFAEETEACDGRRIEYRPVTLAFRLLLRPLAVDDVSFAFGIGILTRFGVANLVGVEASRLTTNFGLRGSVEVAWRVAAPIELVVDLGLDAHTSPAVLTRFPRPPPGVYGCPVGVPEPVLVEDIIGVWGVLAVRLRP